ncbi:pyridoxal phosphate-dependent aminotransferase [Nannocystis radixulma]|uniref:Aminotransferase n=1 Tax=Nannocystis radixulma TaxID=2995305 RepID=A0ABT5BQP4_9BACT|nr:aminotransferase class I/II-fold pyridoxal phosphate-dependent enzyme [Nannocystis radixulma]MDC0675728.1 aminotransferase class I/II-fold pyridoxal phosphate-dependent enzyme [Nannocystis radixulma]
MSMTRFDLNESALGLPEVVRRRVRESADQFHCYPLAQTEQTLARVAEHFGVTRDEVLLTQGIDECVDRLITHFEAMRFVATWPGFHGYWDRIAVMRRRSFALRRVGPTFELACDDVEALERDDFVLLADPDNPTGVVTTQTQLEQLQRRCGRLLVDRTYAGYADAPLAALAPGPRGFYFHSFSKSFAMAGLRVGALIGPAEDIEAMRARQWFCSMSTPSLVAVAAALDHVDEFQDRCRALIEERGRVVADLRARGFRVHETQTNFVIVAADPAVVLPRLAARGMLVKDMGCYGLDGHVRISLRTPAENLALVEAIGDPGAA